MAVKSKTTSKVKPAARKTANAAVKKETKPKAAPKAKNKTDATKGAAAAAKLTAAEKKADVKKSRANAEVKSEPVASPAQEIKAKESARAGAAKPSGAAVKPAPAPVKRVGSLSTERRRQAKKHLARGNQFNFMKPPGVEYEFTVGDTVEVFCDHEKNRDRIRGWVKGIVVQVDHKLAAVQFRSNVYLTDGWMVPDRILWFPVNSEHIRPMSGKKSAAKKEFVIPDY
jgi:hypothetical protein